MLEDTFDVFTNYTATLKRKKNPNKLLNCVKLFRDSHHDSARDKLKGSGNNGKFKNIARFQALDITSIYVTVSEFICTKSNKFSP